MALFNFEIGDNVRNRRKSVRKILDINPKKKLVLWTLVKGTKNSRKDGKCTFESFKDWASR